MLKISSLTATCAEKQILQNLHLTIKPGTVHTLMGPNGAGKTTLAHALIGHPQITINQGSIFFNDQDITEWSPDQRARAGMFISFQHPQVIPGVRIINFLKEAYRVLTQQPIETQQFEAQVLEAFGLVGLDRGFAYRNVNEGFSGGEKKRFEMVQCYLFNPSFIILDELDSGLDIDALKAVTRVLQIMKDRNPSLSLLIITHYRRMFDYLKPDILHVLYNGSIVDSGNVELLNIIEEKGYNAYQ